MGGLGSGRYLGAAKKRMVERCLVIDAADLTRAGFFRRIFPAGRIEWTDFLDGELATRYRRFLRESPPGTKPPIPARGSVGFCMGSTRGELQLHVSYVHTLDGEKRPVKEIVPLETSHPYFGGVRWWFRCPRCLRRRRCLYLPPGKDCFFCRGCHDLTYFSSQTRHCNPPFPGERRVPRVVIYGENETAV